MTGRKLSPDALPGWPRRLGLELAAAYLGISPSKLLEGEGKAYPAAVRDGRRKLWDRQASDKAGLHRTAERAGSADRGLPILSTPQR